MSQSVTTVLVTLGEPQFTRYRRTRWSISAQYPGIVGVWVGGGGWVVVSSRPWLGARLLPGVCHPKAWVGWNYWGRDVAARRGLPWRLGLVLSTDDMMIWDDPRGGDVDGAVGALVVGVNGIVRYWVRIACRASRFCACLWCGVLLRSAGVGARDERAGVKLFGGVGDAHDCCAVLVLFDARTRAPIATAIGFSNHGLMLIAGAGF